MLPRPKQHKLLFITELAQRVLQEHLFQLRQLLIDLRNITLKHLFLVIFVILILSQFLLLDPIDISR